MKTELEMFSKHLAVCLKSEQSARTWGQAAEGRPAVSWWRLETAAHGVISVSSRLAGTCSELSRPALLTMAGLISLSTNHLSCTLLSSDSLKQMSPAPMRPWHFLVRKFQHWGYFNLSICSLILNWNVSCGGLWPLTSHPIPFGPCRMACVVSPFSFPASYVLSQSVPRGFAFPNLSTPLFLCLLTNRVS